MRNDVTRANAVSERKKSFRKLDFFSFAVWTNVKRKRASEETKNIAGQVLTYNSKNFHWLNRKLDQERTMNGLQKPFRKKNRSKKKQKTVKIKVKLPHVNKKPLARKRIFVHTPFSHSDLNLERKNCTPQIHSLFRSTSYFGVTKITTQFDFKNHENVWTDLKK